MIQRLSAGEFHFAAMQNDNVSIRRRGLRA